MKYLLLISFLLFGSCLKTNRFLTPSPAVDPVAQEFANSVAEEIQSQEGALVASPDTAVWRIFALLLSAVFILCFFSNPQWIKDKALYVWEYLLTKYKAIQKNLTKKNK